MVTCPGKRLRNHEFHETRKVGKPALKKVREVMVKTALKKDYKSYEFREREGLRDPRGDKTCPEERFRDYEICETTQVAKPALKEG